MTVPERYLQMKADHPELMAAYEAFGTACTAAGPLDAKTAALVKLAVSLGAGHEGAAHSHTRKALEQGWTADELMHAATLCAPTIGFPTMMRARSWVGDVTSSAAGAGGAGGGVAGEAAEPPKPSIGGQPG